MEDLEIDETQAKENYLILLLGSADSPILSHIFLKLSSIILLLLLFELNIFAFTAFVAFYLLIVIKPGFYIHITFGR